MQVAYIHTQSLCEFHEKNVGDADSESSSSGTSGAAATSSDASTAAGPVPGSLAGSGQSMATYGWLIAKSLS